MRADDSRVLDTLVTLRDRCASWLLSACTSELQFMLIALPPSDDGDRDGFAMNCGAIGNIKPNAVPLIGRTIKNLQKNPDDYRDRVAALGQQWQIMEDRREECLREISRLCETGGRPLDDAELMGRVEYMLAFASPLIHRTLTVLFGETFHFLLVTLVPVRENGRHWQCCGTGNYDAADLTRAARYMELFASAHETSALLFAEPMGHA